MPGANVVTHPVHVADPSTSCRHGDVAGRQLCDSSCFTFLTPAPCAGMTTWPGANFVTFEDGGRWFLKYGDRRKIAADLKARPVLRA